MFKNKFLFTIFSFGSVFCYQATAQDHNTTRSDLFQVDRSSGRPVLQWNFEGIQEALAGGYDTSRVDWDSGRPETPVGTPTPTDSENLNGGAAPASSTPPASPTLPPVAPVYTHQTSAQRLRAAVASHQEIYRALGQNNIAANDSLTALLRQIRHFNREALRNGDRALAHEVHNAWNAIGRRGERDIFWAEFQAAWSMPTRAPLAAPAACGN